MPKRSHPPAEPAEARLRARSGIPAAALFACALMYLADMSILATVPEAGASFTANFAVPFDLMVCVPLTFYLIVVRRRGMTPIAVLPVIYLGGLVSSFVADPNSPTALPVLFGIAAAVDAVVLTREVPKLAKTFRKGYLARKGECPQPIVWFFGGFSEIIPGKTAAHAAAMEASMWYWLVASWRRGPEPPKGSIAFTYHKECGFVALSCVVIALGLVETAVVHIGVSRVSIPAAFILSALSLYSIAWIAANARAAAKSPILVHEDSVTAVWGAFLRVRIEGESIEKVALSDPGLSKREVLDMSSLGGTPCWIMLRAAMETEILLGKKRCVKAVKLSPDRLSEFADRVNTIATVRDRSTQDS